MLKATGKADEMLVQFSGDTLDACADVSAVITGVLNSFDTENGVTFMMALTAGFMQGICFDIPKDAMAEVLDAVLHIMEEKVNEPE